MTSLSKSYIVQSFGRNGAVEDIFNIESGAADPKVISAKQRGRIKILGDTDGGGPGTLNVRRSGSDLQVFMDSVVLDLSAIATHGDRITSVERIDLTGSGDNTLRLTMADVLDIAGQNSFNASGWNGLAATQSQHQLVVDGNAGDKVFTGAGWTLSATNVTNESHVYHVYNAGAAQLLVDERIQVVA